MAFVVGLFLACCCFLSLKEEVVERSGDEMREGALRNAGYLLACASAWLSRRVVRGEGLFVDR